MSCLHCSHCAAQDGLHRLRHLTGAHKYRLTRNLGRWTVWIDGAREANWLHAHEALVVALEHATGITPDREEHREVRALGMWFERQYATKIRNGGPIEETTAGLCAWAQWAQSSDSIHIPQVSAQR